MAVISFEEELNYQQLVNDANSLVNAAAELRRILKHFVSHEDFQDSLVSWHETEDCPVKFGTPFGDVVAPLDFVNLENGDLVGRLTFFLVNESVDGKAVARQFWSLVFSDRNIIRLNGSVTLLGFGPGQRSHGHFREIVQKMMVDLRCSLPVVK
ncbi:hypothetical protein [Burkholderia sp. Ax-1719]|uniref:hypothetical protein n=1 Tax=Burkholderia sp. Ax-1719 TaxID=2608334 RepID=UPI001421DC1E|nr:hypothetical protein [Burkholderia sp. Ax-1719]NIE63133.1 hypothetical protein [Burkholderia sp. Ax-1719]